MYTRRSVVLALLAAGLLPGQDAQPSILVTGAVKQPLTLSAGDLAVDLTCRDSANRLVVIQCKRYREPSRVGSAEVQKIIGMANVHHHADEAIIVTGRA